MAKPSVKKILKVWVVTWPKGTNEEWKKEPKASRPSDYEPISAELGKQFEFYSKKEKRTVYGAPIAVFADRNEALAYEASEGNHFTIRPAYLSVL